MIPELAAGVKLLKENQPQKALHHLLLAAERAPGEPHVWLAAGVALRLCGDLAGSEASLRRATALDPSHAAAWTELGAVLAQRGVREEPLACWRRALAQDSRHTEARIRLAAALLGQGALEQAGEHVAQALQQQPSHPGAVAVAVALLERRGHPEEAWALAESCPSRDAGLAAAAASVGRRAGHTAEALARVEQALPSARGMDVSRLQHARAELLEALGRTEEAFSAWTEANRARGLSFEPQRHHLAVEHLIARTRAARWPERPIPEAQRPVLIVGVPRTGSTVLEQALSRHSGVRACGELEALRHVALSVPRPGESDWADALGRLTEADLAAMRARYLGALGPPSPRATDKMPNNLLHLGLLAAILPGTRVIRCRRDPVDTAWSCFRQSFGAGLPWATDLSWIACWIRESERLLDHWEATLPLRFHSVRYEELASEPERVLREVCTFLDLPFDQAVLSPERATRQAATASAMEVKEALHGRSIGRAGRYERYLPEEILALRLTGCR
jgi:Flp pilus assembly protein TadD